MKRNLVFYCHINSDNINLRIKEHLYLLKKYSHVFTGEKIIFIAVDKFSPNTELLKSHFDFLENARISIVLNDEKNRESTYFFQQLFQLKEYSEPDSITFYAHSKGSTYDNDASKLLPISYNNNYPIFSYQDNMTIYISKHILNWITAMYYFNLENLNKVEENLKQNLFCGIFRIDYPTVFFDVDWHYTGTFYWFSNRIFDIKDWYIKSVDRFSTESFPGKICNIEQSSLSQDLYCDYALHYSQSMYDLRYDGFWSIIDKIITGDLLNKYNKLLNEVELMNKDFYKLYYPTDHPFRN